MSATPAQDMSLSDAGASDPVGVSIEMVEVMYRCGEMGTFKPPFALAASELLTLDLPLDKVEFGLEAFCLLVMMPVSLNLGKKPPIGEGHNAIAEGEIG